ncbi:PREDICTED: cyclin-dependent kinases regulatory subunit 1 [Nanorana parkeri]|uniref:cyclin-dependent kinases regulatory subunit 1 n=1 Tax=Nanorana parkeri TaxID=125878 RepID=UPI0008550013|nr:PREDICTED: cyclin-dependent kinases regulatory subunit 1 [Nanorana parkeri]
MKRGRGSFVVLRDSWGQHKKVSADWISDRTFLHFISNLLLSCRHVMLPKDIAKMVPKTHLMSETEWRNLGVQQSQGWVHYMIHEPEPHILLFRRPLPSKKL